MKAIVQDRYGSAEVLGLGELPAPRVGEDEVLVRVKAAGVDRGVWHLMAGLPYVVRLGVGLTRPRQPVRGLELAGVVEAVGARVTELAVGDEVYGVGTGTFAELALAKPGQLAKKPAGLPFEDAAAVPVSATTALRAVREAQLTRGSRVLVLGAGGGVGSFVVQLARAAGAEVTGVCSGGKAEAVRALGAAQVVDYASQPLPPGPFDAVIDTAGNRPLRQLKALVRRQGTVVVVGGEGAGRWFGGIGRQLLGALASLFTRPKVRFFLALVNTADLGELSRAWAAGRFKPLVSGRYPLERAAEAVRVLEGGHPLGKAVLTLA